MAQVVGVSAADPVSAVEDQGQGAEPASVLDRAGSGEVRAVVTVPTVQLATVALVQVRELVTVPVPWDQAMVRVGQVSVAISAPAVGPVPVQVRWAQVMGPVNLDSVVTLAPVAVRAPVQVRRVLVTDRVNQALVNPEV
jgi:hypothetical protein